MAVRYYRELTVWQKSMDLAEMIYSIAKKLPREELYGLSDQMRRSVVSIPSNIAEGQQRNSTKDYIRFLFISKGSLAELETQLLLCSRMGLLQKSEADAALDLASEISRMLNSLIQKLMNKLNQTGSTNPAFSQDEIRA